MLSQEQIKNTGATFTPKGLAKYLSERIAVYIDKDFKSVLDPACGEGELLIAMGTSLSNLNINFSLNGYDSNREYLEYAKERLFQFGLDKIKFVAGDFLEAIDVTSQERSLKANLPRA